MRGVAEEPYNDHNDDDDGGGGGDDDDDEDEDSNAFLRTNIPSVYGFDSTGISV